MAAKDRVSISDTKETHWFLLNNLLEPPALCGLMKTSRGYRIKGVWVPKELRGNGLGTEMTLNLIDYAENTLMASRIEAFAYNPAFYEQHGFRRFGTLPNGAVKMERIL
jgi:RimJ/RimL family protein N-acetyltransferase